MVPTEVETDGAGRPLRVAWAGERLRVKTVRERWSYAFPWNPDGLGHDRYRVEVEGSLEMVLDHNRRTGRWIVTHIRRRFGGWGHRSS